MTMLQFTHAQEVRIVKYNGFVLSRQSGSHLIFVKGKESLTLVVNGTRCVIFARLIKEHNLKLVDDRGRKVY